MRALDALRRRLCHCPNPLLWEPDDTVQDNLMWAAIDGIMGAYGGYSVDGAAGRSGGPVDIWMADGSIFTVTIEPTDQRWH